jgi:Holliday junction resolvase RusA-like endonuclease
VTLNFETPLAAATLPVAASGSHPDGTVLGPSDAGVAAAPLAEPDAGNGLAQRDPASVAATPALEIHVFGQPATQGSKRHVGHGVMVESSKKLKPWREAVKQAALDLLDSDAINRHGPLLTGPIRADVVFTFTRPKSHYRTGRNAHLLRDDAPMRPVNSIDADKGLRACFDALTDAGVWADDKQVVDGLFAKVYPGTHPDALPVAGAVIRIHRLSALPLYTESA